MNMTTPPVPELPSKLHEKKQVQPETKQTQLEKKIKHRKSWMFWKTSAPVQQQQ